MVDCTNSSFYLLFTLTKKQSGYYRVFVYYNVLVKWFTKTVCFYGVQHAAGCIAIVWAVNNIQLYVSLFIRGLACFRSCFILFSLFHYLYYTTRARGMSNGTASFEYHIIKYTLYFSKYLKRDWFFGFWLVIVPFLFLLGIFLFFAFFLEKFCIFLFYRWTSIYRYIDIWMDVYINTRCCIWIWCIHYIWCIYVCFLYIENFWSLLLPQIAVELYFNTNLL